MQTIDIIKQFEKARYSIYAETIKNNWNTNKMEEENSQAPLDMNSLKPLLSEEDDGMVSWMMLCRCTHLCKQMARQGKY
jgi:hypothetical protein